MGEGANNWAAARPLLAIGVPIWIARLGAAGGPTAADRAWLAAFNARLETDGESLIAPVRDGRRRAERRDTAGMFADLLRAVAIVAFRPGGVDVGDLHFEAATWEGGADDRAGSLSGV